MIDNAKNIEFWDRAAGSRLAIGSEFAGMLIEGREFEALCRSRGEELRLTGMLPSLEGRRVLEIGSGGGRWGFFLADKVGEYIGLDISPRMVELAEKERTRRGLANIRFECKSLLDFESSEGFDVVYFSGVLQYMDDDVVERCIQKAANLLSKSGEIISRDSVQTATRAEKSGDYPVIYRTEAEYRSLFGAGGFALVFSDHSYQHKRFTRLAARLYEVPLVTYGMACAFRNSLCALDDFLGNPEWMKSRKLRQMLRQENPQEHRFFKYARVGG